MFRVFCLFLALSSVSSFFPQTSLSRSSPVLDRRAAPRWRFRNTRVSSSSNEFEGLSVKELKAKLKARGLKVSGLKSELAARLRDDKAGAAEVDSSKPVGAATEEAETATTKFSTTPQSARALGEGVFDSMLLREEAAERGPVWDQVPVGDGERSERRPDQPATEMERSGSNTTATPGTDSASALLGDDAVLKPSPYLDAEASSVEALYDQGRGIEDGLNREVRSDAWPLAVHLANRPILRPMLSFFLFHLSLNF